MTLIAAWRLSDSIVIHADSQETVTMEDGIEYRKTVLKIDPEQMGSYKVVVAGAGDTAFIISFTEKLRRRMNGESADSLASFISIFEEELETHYDLSAPAEPTQFIVGVSCTKTKEYNAWITQGSTLCPFNDHELAGHGETIYKETMNRFWTPGITIQQAVLAGIYLLTLAEATSNYVRSPFNIVIIRGNGIWTEPQKYIQLMRERLGEYEQWVSKVFLACADTSINSIQLKNLLANFSQAAEALHRQHIDRTMDKLTWEEIISTDDPYPRRPLGITTIFADGRKRVEHDPDRIREQERRFEWMRRMTLAAPHLGRCRKCNLEIEYMLANPSEDTGPGSVNCPGCGEQNSTFGVVLKFRRLGTLEWTQVEQARPPSTSEKSEPIT